MFAQNIDCGYTLESPGQGSSNEYPQYKYVLDKKNRLTPVNPSFAI